jgi:hypothetical protein
MPIGVAQALIHQGIEHVEFVSDVIHIVRRQKIVKPSPND